ncbi:MAG: transposase [Proteobacteria bacterium]|nr:transposase [Pseudomonadota bacterium]
MAISLEGASAKVDARAVLVAIPDKHPLIELANAIPWKTLMDQCVHDLKCTTPNGCWWTGRKINVRIHLAAYLLQKLYNLTDRATEYGIKDNGAYRLLCGFGIIKIWPAPDHTKIEEFRSRLSPETQRDLANSFAQVAVKFGFGDPSKADFDSTVQEANIAYPSDASLMAKLCGIVRKFVDYLKNHTRGILPDDLAVNMKMVKEYARSYFFMAKNVAIEKRREVFLDLLTVVKQQMRPVVDICKSLDPARVARLPWNIRRAYDQIRNQAWRYLLDVGHFTRTHTIKAGKILSLHASAVACIKKGKVGKDNEFGRVFQLGRIAGNFLFVLESTSLRMNDKSSLVPILDEHQKLFGEGELKSMSADKGYWSSKNLKTAAKRDVDDIGLQAPSNIKNTRILTTKELQVELRDRRAGIEPLIGHAKHGGQLGKSRMKSDAATLAAGYGSILGFNLRQLIRHPGGKIRKAA